jgi:hypothetical protein
MCVTLLLIERVNDVTVQTLTQTLQTSFPLQIRGRALQSKADPWSPVRGTSVAHSDSYTADESDWRALERRTQNKTTDRLLTS